jgi:hypothetical protein
MDDSGFDLQAEDHNRRTVGVDRDPHEDEWDFYPCLVDDRPASIFLNLRYERDHDARGGDTVAWVRIEMLEPHEHGMGSAAEATCLYPVEDRLIEAAANRGLVYVGRLRNDDAWQLTFYGSEEAEQTLATLIEQVDLGARTVEVGSTGDAEWSYYDEFLVPDPERRQWIHNRRLVETLEEHGDNLATPRRVDHWAYFPTAATRDGFVADARDQGFVLEGASRGLDLQLPFGANIQRDGSVDLDEIHEVVMSLVELAERHGGYYDGWETQVTTEAVAKET